jgi:hypothetical protein
MLKIESRFFEGVGDVSVQQLPAMRAVKLSRRLIQIAAPAVAALKDLSLSADASVLGDAIAGALAEFSEKDLEALIKDLLETATVEQDGKLAKVMPLFDSLFGGKIFTLYKVLAFALEVNFADFFEPLRALKVKSDAEESLKLSQSKSKV